MTGDIVGRIRRRQGMDNEAAERRARTMKWWRDDLVADHRSGAWFCWRERGSDDR